MKKLNGQLVNSNQGWKKPVKLFSPVAWCHTDKTDGHLFNFLVFSHLQFTFLDETIQYLMTPFQKTKLFTYLDLPQVDVYSFPT